MSYYLVMVYDDLSYLILHDICVHVQVSAHLSMWFPLADFVLVEKDLYESAQLWGVLDESPGSVRREVEIPIVFSTYLKPQQLQGWEWGAAGWAPWLGRACSCAPCSSGTAGWAPWSGGQWLFSTVR